jgi:uncharacterized protein HemX
VKAERHPATFSEGDMADGLNLNLVLNGATLLGVIGLGVKVYLAGRAQKIEQPLEVKAAASNTPIAAALFSITPPLKRFPFGSSIA